jgi:hypothetical protein
MIQSYYGSGAGAVLIETREEARLVRNIIAELPKTAEIATIAAPQSQGKNARTGKIIEGMANLNAAYGWAQASCDRVVIVYDWHMLVNNPGAWRALIEALPGLRSPRPPAEGMPNNKDIASLIVFIGPRWNLTADNPLKGALPILQFEAPTRQELIKIAGSLGHELNGEREQVADALTGLTADAAEQAAAECLFAKGGWDIEHLRTARRQMIRDAGLEMWNTTPDLGGLGGFREYIETELLPWIRDDKLAVRRIISAGLPGTGKSWCARWLGHKLNCEVVRVSIPNLKEGLVGHSEANLKCALRTLDALGADSPVVAVFDEIDAAIQRDGLDSGVSSGLFSEMLTWLQESTSRCVVVATLNRLDKLDAALESRFQARFFFELPTMVEREAVAQIHLKRLGVENWGIAAATIATFTDGFSSREIAEHVCPSAARRGNRKPDIEVVKEVCQNYTPASKTQAAQLEQMRLAAKSLRRANDPVENEQAPTGRRIGRKAVEA